LTAFDPWRDTRADKQPGHRRRVAPTTAERVTNGNFFPNCNKSQMFVIGLKNTTTLIV